MNKHFFSLGNLPSFSFQGNFALRCLFAIALAFAGTAVRSQTTIGGVNLGGLPNYLFVFTNGSADANWQSASKGYVGNVAIDGVQATERTSGSFAYAGTISTNSSTLSAWANIVDQNDPSQVNPAQAFGSLNQTSLISSLEADLNSAFAQINALPASPGFTSVVSTSLNGLNKQNGVAETFVINITSGLGVSSKINITGDAGDVFILRWDSDGNPNNGYQGTVKFQSGGAVVPLGGLKPSNFINVAGNINSSGGGSNPPAPYPQGPRLNNGTGALIVNGSNFSGGGFFTGYWLTTGDPVSGQTSPLSNGIFVGGWYSTTSKFSMTSGTSGVYVAPNTVTPPNPGCIGEAANYVLLGLQGGTVSVNSGTNVTGDFGYSAGVTSTTNQKLGDDGVFNGTVYVHGNVAQFSYDAQNFLPSGGIVQNNATQSARLDQANASAVSASANFAALPPNVVLGALGDNDSKVVNRTGSVTVVQITSLDYKEDQLTLVGQAGQNDAFIINVLGNFSFSGSSIVLQNVSPNMVVFNFPNASTIDLNKATNVFNGTILAPTGSVEYHNPAVFNGGIIAKHIKVHSDFNLTKKPLQIPCVNPTTACVGDFAWRDNNGNGVQDAGEPGIAGVTVFLEKCDGSAVSSQTTGADGGYLFCNLTPGDYRLRFVTPANFTISTSNAGTDDCKDSDIGNTGIIPCFNLSPGETDLCQDAGFKPACTITPVVTNIICDGKGTPTTTDDTYTFVLNVTSTGGGTQWSGSFSNACLGVGVIQPTAYGTPVTLGPFPAGEVICGNVVPPVTFPNGFDIGVSVQDAQDATCSKNITVVSPGPCSPGATAGLGDFVWNDLNQNGAQNAGEPGVQGVTVNLYSCGGTFLSTTTTNATGFYSFTNLPSNQQYFVEFINLPAGFQFSAKDAAADNIDSDANTGNGRTDCTFLSPGEFDNTIDAGIFSATPQPASVGDFVWNDLDKDGVQDPGEPGVQGVLVKLFRCDNTFVAQLSTNAAGFYQFTNLAAGSYFVQFSNLPAGFQFTTKDAGADNVDSDADATTGNTACFNLVAGQNDLTRDAGIFQSTQTVLGSVGDFVWFDTDKDGVQDPGEPGVPGIFVILETCTGQFVNFATTNAQGLYLITNVPAGSYRVKFASPGTINGSPVQFTVKDAGGDDTKDSDASSLGFTDCFTLGAGQTNLTLDAGFAAETPPPCHLKGTLTNVGCAEGQVNFTLVVIGSNTGASGYDIPALNQFMLQYGQAYNFTIPGSANPTTLLIKDHNVADCTTTVTITTPPGCTGGGSGTPNCNDITFTPGAGSITIGGLTAPIEVLKVFNPAWAVVFECTGNCSNPTVVSNLAPGTYYVKVQLFTATWQLICTREQYVTVSNLTGGGSSNLVALNESGVAETAAVPLEPASQQPYEVTLAPNPASNYVELNLQALLGKEVQIELLDQLGRRLKTVRLDEVQSPVQRIELEGVQAGYYLVWLRTPGQQPLVKQLVVSKR